MSLSDKAINKIYSIATGIRWKRVTLAPIIGSIFFTITCMFVIVPIWLDRFFAIPQLWAKPLNYFLSFPFLILGIILSLWSLHYFFISKATPVPVHPPQKLITSGPYAYTRNPMHTGLVLLMFAAGFYYSSWLSVFVFTPLYIIIDMWIIKRIEEPELEKRLGKDYIEYKERTPMIFPWKKKKAITL
ncbi:MAG: isoprenylcysteine carboxylmethyltransferase family protein [Chlorobi bacterium]|nr:isoprenylcysteine carboxylmethyltransferase family protein [Chlorobiota bacterium]MCI0716990.1 isoprenylcysteine carboxylmethyltransferase family protein [Chlorobiota bacterium]